MGDPIRVLFDARLLGVSMTDIRFRAGIRRVVEETLDRLVCDKDLSVQLFDSSGSYFCCQAFINEHKKQGYVLFCRSRFWRSKFYVHRSLKTILKVLFLNGFFRFILIALKQYCINMGRVRHGSELKTFQIYHAPATYVPAEIRDIKNIVKVIEVHDLVPVLYQHFLDDRALHGGKHPVHEAIDSLTGDDFVICNSACTRRDLLTYRGDMPPDRVFVAPLAASSKFFCVKDPTRIEKVKQRYRIPPGQKYILSVCTLEPRKNIDTVVRAFGIFIRQNKIEDVVLVLTGAAGWKHGSLLRQADEDRELRKKIVFTGFVTDEDLAALYSDALVFVYLSFYEGFGLPPLEAMQCATPVITSNTSSLPDLVGDAGIMIEPRDEKSAAGYFLRFYSDPGYREGFSQKAFARSKLFSWDVHGDIVKEVYRQALGKAQAGHKGD